MKTDATIARNISLPLSDDVLETLHAGDELLLTGAMYVGRDAAHKRMMETLQAGEPLPVDLKGQVIYFMGPTPARPGKAIGAAGPTSSYRMDAYSPRLMAEGLKGMIGKGMRSREVKEAMKKHKAVYLGAIGGAGALCAGCIRKVEVVAYDDLGIGAMGYGGRITALAVHCAVFPTHIASLPVAVNLQCHSVRHREAIL